MKSHAFVRSNLSRALRAVDQEIKSKRNKLVSRLKYKSFILKIEKNRREQSAKTISMS
jgi:hypothetical protein